jgi:4a-hydroxytetrahydrobiopterin dehydratase
MAAPSGDVSPSAVPPRLTEPQLRERLAARPDWSEFGGQIQRTYLFKNFVESMAFVNKVADVAEHDQHHPDILVRWNKVTLTVSTHDAGGITVKDFDLAAKADRLSGLPESPPAPARPAAKPRSAKKS